MSAHPTHEPTLPARRFRPGVLAAILLLVAAVAGPILYFKYAQKPTTPPEPPLTDAGAGSYAQAGPVGLSVEGVRLGRVRMRGPLGQDTESETDVFVVRTRFKLLDPAAAVKQPPLQRDGTMLTTPGITLTDSAGRQFKQLLGFGPDAVKGRRAADAVLSADAAETTDVLTFESVASASGDLVLEVPASYQVRQPDGTFVQPGEPGAYRFRIPRAVWSAPPPTAEAGLGKWATVGPVSMSVEGARVGKVNLAGGDGTATTGEELLVIELRVRLVSGSVRVMKPPFMVDGLGPDLGESPVSLRSASGGDRYRAVRVTTPVAGRQREPVELSPDRVLETTDLLTFSAEAAKADELLLTIYPGWQEQQPDGRWVETTADGEFRFRIPRRLWAK